MHTGPLKYSERCVSWVVEEVLAFSLVKAAAEAVLS